ncbi:MAG: CpaD family pilus assembly protein [Pseudolabrys sp.]
MLRQNDRRRPAEYPTDYRLRHPITLKEGDRTVEVFVGRNRGGLTPTQRADVLSFAQLWRREATSGIIIDVPKGGPSEHAADDSLREIPLYPSPPPACPQSGLCPQLPAVRHVVGQHQDQLHENDRRSGSLRPVAGESRPGQDASYIENRPFWNLGCSSQRNLAAMVDNPADLVQPRGESPSYTARRTVAIDKYRKGDSPSGTYQGYDANKISDLGK